MNEHNPITQRLDEMVAVWKKNVQPHHRLIRWMLKPEESRMYEGFCRFEASPHGKLDNLFVFFYTPFQSARTYGIDLIKNWISDYDQSEEQRKLLAARGVKGDWDIAIYRKAVENKDFEAGDALLADMITSYRNWLGLRDAPFVFSVLPKENGSTFSFNSWLKQWVKQAQDKNIQLLVFDHSEGNYWGKTFEKYADISCSLHHDLRMKEAVQQIATAGAATDPHANFRLCMFEMGKAVARKDVRDVQHWGDKALIIGKKCGDKMLLATAYITYAGMLFSFDKHQKISALLDDGLRLCRAELAAGNEGIRTLILQYYTYKGAHCQIVGLHKEAFKWFIKAGDEARNFGFISNAVSAYYKAYVFAEYRNEGEQMEQSMVRAMQLTGQLTDEEIPASEYPFLAYAFLNKPSTGNDDGLRKAAEEKMIKHYGRNWKGKVEELKENYTKNKLRQAEAQAMVEM